MKTDIGSAEQAKLVMPKIQKGASIADQVYDIIKGMVVSNEVQPGQLLMENQLARSLGISRSPLREALARLQRDGFVEIVPWRGARVSELTPKYVREIYEVRTALECLAARKAAPCLPDEELDKIEKALKAMRSSLEGGHVGPFNETEVELHGLYVGRCDNDLLQDTVSRLGDHLARIRRFAGTSLEHMLASYEEHWEVLVAMRTRDPDTLERAVRTHLSNVASRILDMLERRSGD